MEVVDYLDIDESSPKYAIEKLSPESEAGINLWHKHFFRYTARAQFWKPRLDIGKKCMNAMNRKIYTPGQRDKYLNTENKWPIELQLIKKSLNTLSNEIEKAIPGSDITYEDESPPENAAKPEAVKTVLSWMKQQLGLDDKRNRVRRNGLITGYPVWLWFEKVRGVSSVPGVIPLVPSVVPWDGALPEEWFDEDRGPRDVIFFKQVTKNELYQTFPNRKAAHIKHRDLLQSDPGYRQMLENSQPDRTARDRENYLYKQLSEATFNSQGGYYFVIQSVYPISKKVRAWINPDTYDVFVPPSDWQDVRVQNWLNEHQDYNVSDEPELNTLQVTTISSDGFVWENREHWYQEEGELPGIPYIADVINNVPTGPVEDCLPYILLSSACATEGLDQVRRGSSRLTVISEGGIKNVSRINSELSAPEGVLIAKKNRKPSEAVWTTMRTPNTTFLEMEDRIQEKLDGVIGINQAMLGGTAPRQSEKAKLRELKQGLSPQGPYVNNYIKFTLKLENLLCKFIPRVLTEEMVITVKDEYGTEKDPVGINVQEDFDYEGEATRIVNDVISPRYRAVASISDDSATSREQQMVTFMELLEAIGNQLLQLNPMLLAKVLGMFPNIFAREASKFLMEFGKRQEEQQMQIAQAEMQQDRDKQAQRKEIEMEKIKRPRIAMKFSPQDIEDAPEGMKVLYQLMRKYEAQADEKELAKEEKQFEEQEQQMAREQVAA